MEGQELLLAALTSLSPIALASPSPITLISQATLSLEYLCSSCHHCGSWMGQGVTCTIIDTGRLGRRGDPASLVTALPTD